MRIAGKIVFVVCCVAALSCISSGCSTTKDVGPKLVAEGKLSADTYGIALRPVEYGLDEVAKSTASAYQVRKNNGKVVEGDNSSVIVQPGRILGLTMAQVYALSPLTNVAIDRAIKSVPEGDAFYVTSIERTLKKSAFRSREDVTVTGRVLQMKSRGTMSEERVDKRLSPSAELTIKNK